MAKLIASIEQEAFEIARGVDEGGGDGHEDRISDDVSFVIAGVAPRIHAFCHQSEFVGASIINSHPSHILPSKILLAGRNQGIWGSMNGISDSHQGDSWKGALDAQLSGWRLRARKLATEIADLQEERSKLEEQIKAAEVLLGRPHIPGMHAEDKPMSVREMALELMKDGKPRDGADIRAALIAAGVDPSKVSTNTGAFYTALGRLVDKKFLTKSDRGVYRLFEGAEEEDKGVFG